MAQDLDWDRLAGDWGAAGGKLRQQWGRLTEEDVAQAGGNRDLLLERIRERYGLGPDEAQRQLQDWASSHGKGAGDVPTATGDGSGGQ